MAEEIKDNSQMQDSNMKPIDLAKVARTLWDNRKKYFIILPAVLVCTYLCTLMVPRYYACEVSIAPESSGTSSGGSLGSLASSFGLGSLAKMAGNDDALYIELYPSILSSNDFVATLMPTEITTKKGDIKCTYYEYIKDKQKNAPWDVARAWISEIIKPTPKDSYTGKEVIDVFNLSEVQYDVFKAVAGNIKCAVDKKTDVATIVIKDQDPLVCATMAKTTCDKLQEFIINYRTKKARIDYEYYKKLTVEAKANYERARQTYGSYSDSNMDVFLESYKSKQEDLENEMQLKYNVYTAMNTQLQAAQAKLQEATPAFTILKSASVPIKPAGPKRVFISIFFTFFVAIIMSIRFIIKKEKEA